MRIESLRKKYDVSLELVHFPLHPETPDEGLPLDKLFGKTSPEERAARNERMKKLMQAEGLPYGERTHTYNSRLAQELGKWAATKTESWDIHNALFKAYFVDGKNVGDLETLVGIAESVGLPGDEARQVLTDRTFKDATDRDWSTSRQSGVTGVPTFAAGGYGVVGAQPYEVIEQLVTEAGAQPRS